mmetsp:Transcript_834/g.1912  ORF Transcript_834/g.1912 Transcript_834/m.1912 type:complete len:210 (-) Transcript_834:1243-1872(-)
MDEIEMRTHQDAAHRCLRVLFNSILILACDDEQIEGTRGRIEDFTKKALRMLSEVRSDDGRTRDKEWIEQNVDPYTQAKTVHIKWIAEQSLDAKEGICSYTILSLGSRNSPDSSPMHCSIPLCDGRIRPRIRLFILAVLLDVAIVCAPSKSSDCTLSAKFSPLSSAPFSFPYRDEPPTAKSSLSPSSSSSHPIVKTQFASCSASPLVSP